MLFIDKANRPQSPLCDKDGQVTIEKLFQWSVLHKKGKCHFHVITASTFPTDNSKNFFEFRHVS